MPSAKQNPLEAAGTYSFGNDLPVQRLGFGAMRITGNGVWGEPKDRQEAIRVLHRALELGINLIDTADSYGPEVSETLIAEALYPYPKNLVIATKGGFLRSGPNQWHPDGRPEHLREAIEGSLQRLRVERIDVYQFHTVDPNVALEDSLGTLAELQKAGKIRHIGVSNVNPAQLAQARKIVSVVSVQNRYNLTDRASEEMVDICEREGLGFIPWFPLATGELARPGSRLDTIAKQHNAAPSQIALAWLLKRSTTMLPIPGTSTVEHLEENVAGASITLSDEEFNSLSKQAS
ncbi:MAG: aldo/keto reductase [Ktedonobacteraceae bacterium]